MTVWQRAVHRPQRLWLRKAMFQVHLWVGIGVGLYVLVISVSGAAIVYHRELLRRYSRKAIVVEQVGRRMSVDEVRTNVQRAYPAYEVDSIREPQRLDRPDVVVLERRRKRIERVFDPYTGADLGDPQSGVDRVVQWLVDLHDNLLGGQSGRLANGAGACLVTLLALTGAILWWPGIRNWRRSTTINWKTNLARINWDMHSAIGFWCSLFVLVWGISGICFCFPGMLNPLVGGHFLFWITQLHFGRFTWFTEIVWTVAGLAPAVLFGTGALMWWNRVLRKRFRRPAQAETDRAAATHALT